MLGYYNYTVVPTYLGLLAAVAGICFAVQGHPTGAVYCLMAAGLLDMFDGKIAHTRTRTPEERRFGIQIDSLCDLISFGVLPTLIGWSAGLKHWGYALIFAAFILAALIRLAYFNVAEEQRQDCEEGARQAYQGLPVTSVALLLPLLYSLRVWIGDAFPVVYAVALALIALAFVGRFSIKKPGWRGQLVMLGIGIAELVLLLTVGA